MMYNRGDIVTYESPRYGRQIRVRLTVPIVTPHGKPGWDAVIIDQQGEPDIANYFFTSVWCDEDQIRTVERRSELAATPDAEISREGG